MEIARHQFLSSLPTVQKAIDECEFMAIDTELSGLHRPAGSRRLDTLANRYAEYREATRRFIIIQFGLCTFKWDEPSGRYIAKAFNFYIFPTSMTGKIQPDRLFLTQAQAFDFLSKQGFDFNKWIYQGIPYLTVAEEEAYVQQARRKMSEDMPDIRIDDKEKSFVETAKQRIDAWIQDPSKTDDKDGVNIETRNAYQRRLIYQEVRKHYPDLTADGRNGFIRVVKLTDKQREKRAKDQMFKLKKDCAGAVGFRRVIDMISASRKPVVGHNMLLDMCHVIAQFIQPLPEDVQDFKKLARKLFPCIADTKYICAASPYLQPVIGTATSLEILRSETNRDIFSNPRIDMDMEFPRYINDMQHEAGYDAYITGISFLKLLSYVENQVNPPPPPPPEPEHVKEEKKERGDREANGWDISDDEEEEDSKWLEDDPVDEVYNYGSIHYPLRDMHGEPTPVLAEFVNKVTMVRTGFVCFDFAGPEKIDETMDGFYLLCEPTATFPSDEALQQVFESHGRHIVDRIDDKSAFVVYENIQGNVDAIKQLIMEQLSSGVVVETIADYVKRVNAISLN